MTTGEFLSQLRLRDVQLWAEGDRLRCNAPQGVLTAELQAELAHRKPEVLAFLRAARGWAERRSAVVPIQPLGSRPPFFGVPGHNGDVFCYLALSQHLGLDQPLYAFEPPGVDGREPPLRRIEDLAAHLVTELRRFQPEGPYRLGGFCLGGIVAFEMAQQLRAKGEELALVVLMETTCPTSFRFHYRVSQMVHRQSRRAMRTLRALARSAPGGALRYLRERTAAIRQRRADEQRLQAANPHREAVKLATMAAVRRYVPRTYPGRLDLFLASADSIRIGFDRPLDWSLYAADGATVHKGPDGCEGSRMLREPYVRQVADRLRDRLAASHG